MINLKNESSNTHRIWEADTNSRQTGIRGLSIRYLCFATIRRSLTNFFNNNLQQSRSISIDNLSVDELKDIISDTLREQISQINVIRSKIIYFSLAIIQSIQKIVEKEVPLLTNNNQEPFIQNACCNNGEYNTLDYFTKKWPCEFRHLIS